MFGVLAAAAALMIALALRFEQVAYHGYLQDLKLEETLELVEVREEIEERVFKDFLILQRLASFLNANPQPTQGEFASFAHRLQEDAPDILNFAAAPDLVVEYVYPLEKNRSVLGSGFITSK